MDLTARILELVAAEPDSATINIALAPTDFQKGYGAMDCMRDQVPIGRAIRYALEPRPTVTRVRIAVPGIPVICEFVIENGN